MSNTFLAITATLATAGYHPRSQSLKQQLRRQRNEMEQSLLLIEGPEISPFPLLSFLLLQDFLPPSLDLFIKILM